MKQRIQEMCKLRKVIKETPMEDDLQAKNIRDRGGSLRGSNSIPSTGLNCGLHSS